MISARVGGTWLPQVGPVGDLKWSTVYGREGGGMLTASWSMFLPRGFTHPALRQGSLVELFEGPLRLGALTLAEPDRESWSFVADGLYRQGERYVAVDALGAPSTDVSVVVAAAIARGLPWKNPGGLPSGAVSAASEQDANLNTVTALLNRYCQDRGKRWLIDINDYLRIVDDPTDPSWVLSPGTPAMATADDDYASTLFGRYVSAVSGTPPEPSAWDVVSAADPDAASRWGVREQIEDLTNLGTLTSVAAQALLQERLDTERVRPAFTQGVEVASFQIATPGGVPAYLPFVQAGQRVTQHGVLDSDGGQTLGRSLSWVIGGTEQSAAGGSITLTPVGLAPRTTAAVTAAQEKAAQAVFA